MDLIPSFSIDHTKLYPGIYESRVDAVGGDLVTTFDIRMTRPNVEPCIEQAAMHTIEHVIATFLRNHPEWKGRLIYWGQMGCNTGFYMIVKGHPAPADVYPVILEAFEYMANYEGLIPGATAVNCGNYHMHNLPMAKYAADRYVWHLKHDDFEKMFHYPATERPTVDGGIFYDS